MANLTELPFYLKRDAYQVLHGSEWWDEDDRWEMDKQLADLQRILDKVNDGRKE